ncbi:C-C motif chemokine 20 [Suncus etruscus]|uniref:C-C motif chemokine 20 n=1 Tax=Suncus etruscus TaxID=109475 RepID=UPI00210FD763|nr:C-C motif chemokine 20 [Suncus etruscus]
MCSNKKLLMTALLSVLLLYFIHTSAAASNFDCCLGYTQSSLPPKLLVGFAEQHADEGCDIDAIIFFTKERAICADPKKIWVKKAMRILRLHQENKPHIEQKKVETLSEGLNEETPGHRN